MPEKKIVKALKIFGIVLLVFVVIFAAAVGTLYIRARHRRAQRRNTRINDLPLAGHQRIGSHERGPGGMAEGRKKSMKEKDKEAVAKHRMNLAFGVVDDDEPSLPPTQFVPTPTHVPGGPYSQNPFIDQPGRTRTFESVPLNIGIPLTGRSRSETREPLSGTRTALGDPFASPLPQRPSPSKQKSLVSVSSNFSKTTYKSDPTLLKSQRSFDGRALPSLLSSTSSTPSRSPKRGPSQPVFKANRTDGGRHAESGNAVLRPR
ncbi:hypothetical protein QFC22_004050 [Naganishia vaughanmartiniae]|uniref:Uncharacterized protein n=1 Tax=Naganishia vaughanmartiniae TaxID=1424756 RepID=A0ACC2X2M7_9TREE|nr:hypothetical protein QFC22_004050 [Naganishia vaughanmartiniae]